MNWLFGRRKAAEQSAAQLQQQVKTLEDSVSQLQTLLKEQSGTLDNVMESQLQVLSQNQELQAQLTKSAQLQYRWTQQQSALLETLIEQHEEAETFQESLRQSIAGHVSLLDDIETALRHMQNSGNDAWEGVLRQWQQSLRTVLSQLDVEPLDPLGQPFDTKIAEAAGTMSADEAAQRAERAAQTSSENLKPYTVVETLRLGYRWQGRILRKALVVTIEEDESHAEND